jgi:tripartite-type tricarboxylate transporter receptor subunit TctC
MRLPRRPPSNPEFAKKVEQEGLAVVASDPAELDRYVKAEEARWKKDRQGKQHQAD